MILKCSESGCKNTVLSLFVVFINEDQFEDIQESILLIKKELRKAYNSDRWNNSKECCIHVLNKLGIKYKEITEFVDFSING